MHFLIRLEAFIPTAALKRTPSPVFSYENICIPLQMFSNVGVFKIYQNSLGNNCAGVHFCSLQASNFIRKRRRRSSFPVKFAKVLRKSCVSMIYALAKIFILSFMVYKLFSYLSQLHIYSIKSIYV